jgi:hypothetical protein
MAPLVELAEGTMFIQHQLWGSAGVELPEFLKDPPRLSMLEGQCDPTDFTPLAVDQDPVARCSPLEWVKEQATECQQRALDMGGVLDLMEQYWYVVEVAERRGSRRSLKRVDTDGEPLGLQGSIQYERDTALEHRWCDGWTAEELTRSMSGQQFVRGCETYTGALLV